MSFGELLFLAILALLVFGPRKLPEVARTLAKIIAELRRASNEFRYSLEEEIRTIEASEREQKLLQVPAAHPVEGTIAREAEASPAPAPATPIK